MGSKWVNKVRRLLRITKKANYSVHSNTFVCLFVFVLNYVCIFGAMGGGTLSRLCLFLKPMLRRLGLSLITFRVYRNSAVRFRFRLPLRPGEWWKH